MINIAHLTFDMRIGGTEQVIMNIVNGERSKDIRHRILCIETPLGPFGQRLLKQGITIDSWDRKSGFDRQLIKHIRPYRYHSLSSIDPVELWCVSCYRLKDQGDFYRTWSFLSG
jgi:hypothetical protein